MRRKMSVFRLIIKSPLSKIFNNLSKCLSQHLQKKFNDIKSSQYLHKTSIYQQAPVA
ncbi:uncharacterized protein CELE_F22F4.4 [Caenorhabditis elegans]|uniref:Uncharacterized protein n=1 Tax=Caenorhabditis elegans TaxID=6239 RepID=H2KYL5_CAEEL|nr:Uncharacterized protein CELE_F22F4.4 [Caenorhabditis elegans]CCD63818.1 Uncharacterized protein CELE_F22F4.4 [Caenorhabditis elegans]|eukprot:NP_001257036.1 Uncharacterized protein CELE_F22F4.4 [Caenorhabditis elegans]